MTPRTCLPPKINDSPVSFQMPPGACDCHAHVFGPYVEFPLLDDRSYTPPEAIGETFIRHLDGLGLARGVLVTATVQPTDNANILSVLHRWPDRLRGVVVPRTDISRDELEVFHGAGIRALRINILKRQGKLVMRNGIGLEELERLAPWMIEKNWHAEVLVNVHDLPEIGQRLLTLKLPLVIDHMGSTKLEGGVDSDGFRYFLSMLSSGSAWAKISGADRNSTQGPTYQDVDPLVAAILRANDQNVVWGSDWPHINYHEEMQMPDDGILASLLQRWLPSPVQRHRVLVDNPARLYGFGSTV